jgi:nucleotide-binding universal stress UspA family protein
VALKDILVHVDNGSRSAARIGVALGLARQHGAHLIGLCVADIPNTEYFYGATLPFAGGGVEQVVQRMRADAVAVSAGIEAAFRDRIRREDVEGEWRFVEGKVPATVALHARYADLTVVGQPNPYDASDDTNRDATVVTPLMSSGRPVLVVPFAGEFTRIGQHVLVAWNASREAARAVNDALPLLEKAAKVTVLAVNPRQGIVGHGDVPATDIALHLARHGVKAEAAHTVANDIPDGDVLLSYAADLGADMIVAGGYGHSRAREMVFGGVTRTLIEEMTVPVFLSH